jgi:hypothetical protein
MMSLNDWLVLIVLGGLAGAGGQVARVVVGLKKMNDEASARNLDRGDLIDVPRLVVSLIIGFVAGMFAAIVAHPVPAAGKALALDAQSFLGFAAAGYTGTDFIEGIMSKFLPSAASKASGANRASSQPNTPTMPDGALG